MAILNKLPLVAIVAASAFAATPASAQVAGIASASPTVAIARSAALAAANEEIKTAYATNLAKMDADEKLRQAALAKLDTNGDKQVDDAELDAASKAKNPALTEIQNLDKDMGEQSAPIVRAQAYAIELVSAKYNDAQDKVVAAKKLNVILSPESFVYAPESADVTDDITKQLDIVLPRVSIAAPADWRPSRQTQQLQQQIQQIQQYAALQAAYAARAQQAAGTQPGTAPATAKPAAPKKPVDR